MKPAFANAAWFASALPEAAAYRRAWRDVRSTQERVLLRILRDNTATQFGRRHRFITIDSVDQFRAAVPVSTWDDYSDDLARIAGGEAGVLTRDRVTHFVPTSGTTTASKLVPYTASLLREFQRGIAAWVADLFASDSRLLGGRAYWSVSPVMQRERVTAGGIPIGFDSDDAYLGGLRRRLVRAVQAVPPEVASLDEIDAFRYATLFFLLTAPDLRLISVWNPTFLTLLLEPLEEHGDALARDVAWGTLSVAVPLALRTAAAARCDPRRARAIATALSRPTPAERYAALWPELRVISCWSDAAAAVDAARLATLFPNAKLQPKGLLSSEAFVSLPVGGARRLAIRSHFLEFRDRGGAVHLAHEIVPDTPYEVVVTTGGGLYRYATGDEVILEPSAQGAGGNIRFLGRLHTVDSFGEKLTEPVVREALRSATSEADVRFAMLARDEPEGSAPAYALFIDTDLDDGRIASVALRLDHLLQENVHYRYCRELGQLAPLRAFRIAGRGDAAYLSACAAMGQRLGDIKPLALHPARGWSRRMEGRWL